MKLSEMNYDQLCDAIVDIAPAMDAITDDPQTTLEMMRIYSAYKTAPENQQSKKMLFTLVPHLARTHREDVLKIVSVLTDKPTEQLRKMHGLEVIRLAVDCVDRELVGFFTSPAPTE